MNKQARELRSKLVADCGNNPEEVKYQTWLVAVNIDNVKSNYNYIMNMGELLLTCDDYDFKVIIRSLLYHDIIKWNCVDFKEIREHISNSI